MSTKPLLLPIVILLAFSNALSQSMGSFSGLTHIGNPNKKGALRYDQDNQVFALEGSSGNMWFDKDDFHFLWRKLSGDFILQAQVQFIGPCLDPHCKVGLMVRDNLEPNSPHINAVVHGDGLTSLQYRKTAGGQTEETKSESKGPDVIQLQRKGNTYTMSVAHYGEPFMATQIADLTLNPDAYAGIFLCSHNESSVEMAVFRNVRIIVPVKDDYTPYRDYIGSNIEVMDVATGLRKILYTETGSLQAPNWTLDGKSLIYNKEGSLYSLDLATNKPTKINTGFADRNNNDHVLSFDGKMLGISHHSSEDNNVSMVYTLPASGGVPKKITTKGPSYLHGWSPDGKFLIYTGGRDSEYDIYKISAKGGDEINLTNSKGLDDGSEYSPDGKYIYFNSTRTGSMQIWRMSPDGKNPEQVTNDEYNNWFPHISPDGKWMVYLSYGKDVKPDEHPFYKHVMLRLLPVEGGKPKTIAYLYGGQGTINVPSWSPDGKKIAFVSNTDFK